MSKGVREEKNTRRPLEEGEKKTNRRLPPQGAKPKFIPPSQRRK
jgi:hypothetical protein